jgi:ATP/maltotriose-dependent transcriptional regulator MalT
VLADVQKATAESGNDTETLMYLGNAAVAVGAFDVGDALLSAGTQGLRADGWLGHLAYVLSVQGIVTTRLPRWDVATPAAEEARSLASELGQPLWKAAADTIVSAIAGMRGDENAAEQASAEAERIAVPVGANCIVAMAQFGRVSAALGASRRDDAYAAAERLFDPTDPGHHPAMAAWIIGDLAEAALHAGRVKEARARVAQVEAAGGDNPPSARSGNSSTSHTARSARTCTGSSRSSGSPRAESSAAHSQQARRRNDDPARDRRR